MGLGRIAVVSAFVLSVPCWPALVNGQPFFTLDTIAYLHAAAHGVNGLLGIETAWYPPPVAILACAHIVVRFDRLERWEFLFWFCALCYSMLVHFSHLLTVAGLTILAALHGVRSINKARWFACGTLATAMVIALLGER